MDTYKNILIEKASVMNYDCGGTACLDISFRFPNKIGLFSMQIVQFLQTEEGFAFVKNGTTYNLPEQIIAKQATAIVYHHEGGEHVLEEDGAVTTVTRGGTTTLISVPGVNIKILEVDFNFELNHYK